MPQGIEMHSSTHIYMSIDLPDTTADLLRLLRARDPRTRTAAAEKLGTHGLGTDALRAALRDRNSFVRSAAARGLGHPAHPGRDDIIDDLRGAIHDPSDHVAAAAIYALGRLGATEAIDDIASYINSTSPVVRLAAVRALGSLEAREQAPPIAALLDVPDPKLRAYTIAVLHRLEYHDSAPRILEALAACLNGSPDGQTINYAVQALADFGHTPAIPLLADIARSRFGHRTRAVQALIRLKAYDVAPSLVSLYGEDTATLPQALTALMIAADHCAASPNIRPLLQHASHAVRVVALKAVATWHDVKSRSHVRYMALHETDPLLASQAMTTWYSFDPHRAERDLVGLAQGERVQIARFASTMLREHGVHDKRLHEQVCALAQTMHDEVVRDNLRLVVLRPADDAAPSVPHHCPEPPTTNREVVVAYLTAWWQDVSAAKAEDLADATLPAALAEVLRALGQPTGEVPALTPISKAA